MYEEYKETHITPASEMTKPPQRSPFYMEINRKKVFEHDHLKEKDIGVGPAHAYCNLQRQAIRFFIHVVIFPKWFEL